MSSSENFDTRLLVRTNHSRFGKLSPSVSLSLATLLFVTYSVRTLVSFGKPSNVAMALSVRSMASNWFSVTPRFSMIWMPRPRSVSWYSCTQFRDCGADRMASGVRRMSLFLRSVFCVLCSSLARSNACTVRALSARRSCSGA